MRKDKLRYFYIFLCISISYIGYSQNNLEGYLSIAAQNNPDLKVKFNQYMAALQKGDQVGTLPDPQISFGYFIMPVETKVGPQQLKISAQQFFPWFGKLKANRSVADEVAKLKYELFEDAKSKLFYDVKSAYYKLYFTSKAIKVVNENLAILETLKKLAIIKVESGMVSAVDELRIEMEINDLENKLALLRDNYFAQSVAFNNLLNVESNKDIQIPDKLKSDSLEFSRMAILDSIQSKNHQLTSIDFELTSMQQKEIAARKNGKPNFMVGIDYTFVGESDNPAVQNSGKDILMFPRIGITIPVFRKKHKAMVEEALIYQQVAKDKKESKSNMLKSIFENVYKDYQDADRREKLYVKQAIAANRAMRLLQSEYATSSGNFEEILRMENRLLKYELELEKATADKNTAKAFILYLMGK